MEINDIKTLPKEEVLHFIRTILMKEDQHDIKNHYRFEMSGYESETGKCTMHNLFVLNKFAHLGLYDYTTFLFLDFYKGTPTLYLQYFWEEFEVEKVNYSGYSTTEIIYEILKMTALSGKPARRRS